MPKLESLNGNTVMHDDGTLEMKNSNRVEGFKFCINDNPGANNFGVGSQDFKYPFTPGSENCGILCNFNGVEVGIQVAVWKDHKDKLDDIQQLIINALENAE